MVKDSKKFILNASKRFELMHVLPNEHNYITIRLITDLRKELELSSKDLKFIEAQPAPNGGIAWNVKKGEELIKEVSVDDFLIGVINEELKKLEKEQKITNSIADLYEMFVQSKESKEDSDKKTKSV